jgi:hypothetical protein
MRRWPLCTAICKAPIQVLSNTSGGGEDLSDGRSLSLPKLLKDGSLAPSPGFMRLETAPEYCSSFDTFGGGNNDFNKCVLSSGPECEFFDDWWSGEPEVDKFKMAVNSNGDGSAVGSWRQEAFHGRKVEKIDVAIDFQTTRTRGSNKIFDGKTDSCCNCPRR